MKNYMKQSAFDRTVQNLCESIDYLEAEVDHWKTKYEEEIRRQSIESKERLEEAQRGVANALMFALSVREDSAGNLVIPKEDRRILAENYK